MTFALAARRGTWSGQMRAHASTDVKGCWLVLGPEKKIEVYRQPKDGQFTEHALYGPGGSITSAALKITLPIDALCSFQAFCSL